MALGESNPIVYWKTKYNYFIYNILQNIVGLFFPGRNKSIEYRLNGTIFKLNVNNQISNQNLKKNQTAN